MCIVCRSTNRIIASRSEDPFGLVELLTAIFSTSSTEHHYRSLSKAPRGLQSPSIKYITSAFPVLPFVVSTILEKHSSNKIVSSVSTPPIHPLPSCRHQHTQFAMVNVAVAGGTGGKSSISSPFYEFPNLRADAANLRFPRTRPRDPRRSYRYEETLRHYSLSLRSCPFLILVLSTLSD